MLSQRMGKIENVHPLTAHRTRWRARKNYQRLCARYPSIMQRLGLNEFSVYWTIQHLSSKRAHFGLAPTSEIACVQQIGR